MDLKSLERTWNGHCKDEFDPGVIWNPSPFISRMLDRRLLWPVPSTVGVHDPATCCHFVVVCFTSSKIMEL